MGKSNKINIPVDGQSGKSFQNWIMKQPIRMGGLGIRSQAEVCSFAFIGGVEQALPHFTHGDRICPQLEDVIGNFEETSERWKKMIDSGCRTGKEFATAWQKLKHELQQHSDYLGQEPTLGPLSEDVYSAGGDSEDGSTRKLLMHQIEDIRGAVLKENLSRHPDPTSRQVIALQNRDKLSSSWLQCLPGPNGLNNAAFSEALALTLCMPSPACRDRVGAPIGKRVVDLYGDNVQAEHLPGDHWRTRHDGVKMTLNSLLSWSRISADCEVFGLFSHLIPRDGLSRLDSGRARQALVPDFRIKIPCPVEGSKMTLAELKILSCCPSWYRPSGNEVKATDRRAQGLTSDYRRKARKIDQDILKTPSEQRGPVERRLDEFGEIKGLCFGAFGEASQDVHDLIQSMAESRLKFQVESEGRPGGGSNQELGLIVGQIRRTLSMAAIKAQVECLLARIHQAGPGNKQLAKKRQWTLVQDQKMKKERNAQWIRRIEGIRTIRKGAIKTA